MKTLLGYIGKDKHADSLVEKLMLRFETAAKPAQWRNLAFCLTQVPHNLANYKCSCGQHCRLMVKAAAGWVKCVASSVSWLHASPVGCRLPSCGC